MPEESAEILKSVSPEIHLELALRHCQHAAEKFEDGSAQENSAENAVAWVEKAVNIADRGGEDDV